MITSLSDVATALPPDPGVDQAVSDWAAQYRAGQNNNILNAGVYVPTNAPGEGLEQWLKDNSTVIVAGCAIVGLLFAVGKR